MTKYEKLLDAIAQEDILFIETKSEKQPAKSMRMEEDCAIFFNEAAFDTEAERLVALAHEKGHCDSGAFYCLHTPYETRGRCEQRAWRRSILELLPFDQLMDALKACRTEEGVSAHDLSDYLSLPPDFIARAMDDYLRLGKRLG